MMDDVMTLEDVYKLFYVLVLQNQILRHKKDKIDVKMSFDLNIFNKLPKQLKLSFQRKHGRLFVWIPKKVEEEKKSSLFLPKHEIITPN